MMKLTSAGVPQASWIEQALFIILINNVSYVDVKMDRLRLIIRMSNNHISSLIESGNIEYRVPYLLQKNRFKVQL